MDNPATTDLMNTLSSATNEKNLDEYLNMLSELGYQTTFAGYYEYMLKKKDLLKSEAIAASYLNNIYAYQILEGKKKAGREKILCLCIGAGFNLEETQRALEISKNGILYSKDTRDAIIIYAIGKKMSVRDINCLLEKYNELPLDS